MRYIFISPHLDDIPLSCGGIVNNLTTTNHVVEIWTFFAGTPQNNELTPFAQSLHDRWKLPINAPDIRRDEDMKACAILGASVRYFDFPDCIYRFDQDGKPIIEKEEDLYQDIPDSEQYLVNTFQEIIKRNTYSSDIIVSPMAIGNHVDHRIVLASILKLKPENLFFYEDYPYVSQLQHNNSDINQLIPWQFNLSQMDIENWHKSISEYQSQISTFWQNTERMKQEIINFANQGGGQCLWERKK